MELILSKPTKKLIEWDFGPPHNPGEMVWVDAMEEVCVIENFINYNNLISLSTSVEENDWELQIDIEVFKSLEIKIGDWVYVPESEWGGIITDIERIDKTVKVSGPNFRGYLTKHIITPPYSRGFGDYLRLSQEANELIWRLFENDHSQASSGDIHPDEFVVGSNKNTNVIITDQWRFVNYLTGLTKSLQNNGMRIQTKQVYVDYDKTRPTEYRYSDYYKGTESFIFSLTAEPITDYSNDDLFSQDYDIKISAGHFTKKAREYLYCLGSGEMEEREIVVLKNGNEVEIGFGDTFGSLKNTDIFDYPNAESREELISAGIKRYFEKNVEEEYIKMSVDNTKIEFFLGDIIAGEDFITGIKTKAEIISKELSIANGSFEIDYKIGGLV